MTSSKRWSIWVLAAVFLLTFAFNARQEFFGPANIGWTPGRPFLVVGHVAPASAADRAGVHSGDRIEAVNGRPVLGMADWFVERAHFETGKRVQLRVRRDNRIVDLSLIIDTPDRRPWHWQGQVQAVALYCVRFLLLVLAILITLRHHRRVARLAAVLLAIGSVAEGYPSSGWAASLAHLPFFLAIPICVASVSCLMAPFGCLAFTLEFLGLRPGRSWIRNGMLGTALIFGALIASCSVAMIYVPALLNKPWPAVLQSAPVRLVEDICGVTPLLFLNTLQFRHPPAQILVLELWLMSTLASFAGALVVLFFGRHFRVHVAELRRARPLQIAVALFTIIVVHNVFVRNWTPWFGTPPPLMFSSLSFVVEAVLFLIVPALLWWALLPAASAETRAQP